MFRRLFLTALLAVSPQLVFAGDDAHALYLRALERMMVDLAPHNARAAAVVRSEYRPYFDPLVLDKFSALEDALATGGLVPLPANHEAFNLRVRTDGPAAIAEKDRENQERYIAARPATVGALLDIAARVKSGPLEITSLVRHSEYQDELRATNVNATTSIPMHTLGLAFDIALVNTPLPTVYEIRDVLKRMQDAGEILFIGERKQLVFHVVPHPTRLGYFTEIYQRALHGLPIGDALEAHAVAALAPFAQAVVSAEITAILPTDEHAAEWWAAGGVPVDFSATAAPPVAQADEDRSFLGRLADRLAAVVTGVVSSARAIFS
jgi:hypothetical protein